MNTTLSVCLTFQSTLPRRERQPVQTGSASGYLFQSTLPRRERHARHASGNYIRDFNPRSREGSDKRYPRAPTQTIDFNPRSREGSDIRSHSKKSLMNYFNPRSREGSDAKVSIISLFVISFQSTLPRRERPLYCVGRSKPSAISIHAPAKGATISRQSSTTFQ